MLILNLSFRNSSITKIGEHIPCRYRKQAYFICTVEKIVRRFLVLLLENIQQFWKEKNVIINKRRAKIKLKIKNWLINFHIKNWVYNYYFDNLNKAKKLKLKRFLSMTETLVTYFTRYVHMKEKNIWRLMIIC